MKALIIANWKMNPPTFDEAQDLFEETKAAADKARDIELVVAPPTVFLAGLRRDYRGKRIAFAVQNAYFEPSGPHTGETSLAQAEDAGAHWAIIGHAERRASGETDADVRRKVAATLMAKMIPVLCVGERTRDASGAHLDFVGGQLRAALADVSVAKLSKLVIAYEPIWAIGAVSAMRPSQMHEMSIFIRKTLVDLYGKPGMSVEVLYGGSIDETNAADMIRGGDVQGLLVGRASVDAKKFSALIKAVAAA